MATIRTAEPADADAIWRVHTASIRGLTAAHYHPDQVESWAAGLSPQLYRDRAAKGRLWVAEVAGDVVAFAQLDPGSGEVEALYVHPDHVRQGLGRRLLRHLEAEAQRAGNVQVHLSASQNAVTFYQRMGYRVVGHTEHCLPAGGRLHCTDMRRGLPTDPALRHQEGP